MLFIRANTLFNIRTPSICLISPSILCPSDITIHPSSYPYVPACTLAPVAFYPSFCQLMHKQPPGHYSGIPALVPGGAMCTAGMAMLGSAFLQPTGYMLHVSKCSIVIDFCTKPCRAGLFSISAMSVRKFPFWDKFRTCSTQRLGTAFRLIGPGAPLFLSPPISCPVCHLRPTHLSICQLRQLQTSSVHPSDNSVQTPSIFSFFGQTFRTPTCVCPSPMDNILSDWARSPFIPTTTHLSFCLSTWLPTLPTLSRLPPNPPTSTFDCPQLHSDSDHIRLPFLSGLCGLICPSHNSIHPAIHQIHISSFFGQTFGTPTCVCPSPMDNILSDWAQSPFIPTTTHLLALVPFLVHPPIRLATLATPDSVCPSIQLFFFLDTLGPGLQGLGPKGGTGTSYG